MVHYKMMTSIFLFGLILGLTFAATPFKDCGSKEAKVKSLQVGNCTAEPCIFKKGSNVTVTMTYVPNTNVVNATFTIYAKVGPVKIPIPVPDSNACHFTKCPLVSGTEEVFKDSMVIGFSYPSVTVSLDWTLKSSGDIITCVEFQGKIVD